MNTIASVAKALSGERPVSTFALFVFKKRMNHIGSAAKALMELNNSVGAFAGRRDIFTGQKAESAYISNMFRYREWGFSYKNMEE